MKKKVFSLILLFSCGTLLAGCNDVKDLTDEETGLIAEYAAEMLLKYDLSYTDRIVQGEKEAKDMAMEEEPGTQESSTTEVATEEKDEQDSSGSNNADNRKDTEKDNVENPDRTENDIAKIIGASGVSITYKDYLITDHYPMDEESVNLQASEGHQLLVVRFKVANATEDTVDISLLDKEVDYRILCNGSVGANPMLTILTEDLETLETSVAPSEEQEAVLVFEISDTVKDSLESIELNIHYNDMNNAVNIL